MSLLGGAIGVLCGVGVAKLITLIIGFPTNVELWSVLLGLFVSGATEISFPFILRARRPSWTLWSLCALNSKSDCVLKYE